MEKDKAEEMVCAHCGFIGKKQRFSKGNYLLEILLWTLLFIPGVLYTTWRSFNEFHACPICKNEDMTPLNSPLGQKIAHERERMNQPVTKKDVLSFLSKLFYGK